MCIAGDILFVCVSAVLECIAVVVEQGIISTDTTGLGKIEETSNCI